MWVNVSVCAWRRMRTGKSDQRSPRSAEQPTISLVTHRATRNTQQLPYSHTHVSNDKDDDDDNDDERVHVWACGHSGYIQSE